MVNASQKHRACLSPLAQCPSQAVAPPSALSSLAPLRARSLNARNPSACRNPSLGIRGLLPRPSCEGFQDILPMADEPRSGAAPEQLEKPEEDERKPSSKTRASPSSSSRKAGSSSSDPAAAAVSPDPTVSAASVPAKGGAAKTSARETLAIPGPVTRNSGFLPNGSPGGGGGRSFSQLLAGAMASPVGTSRATPILAVPVDAVRLPVVAVPCIIAPAALLESSGFTGQFAMTHQAVLATVTAQAQMQLQSAYTPQAMISSPVPMQQRPSVTSEDNILSLVAEQQPSSDQKFQTTQIVLKTTSGDGFNWRKYGQKQVKSGENSRSYYKCTQANCFAKKKVERYQDGRVVEVIYRGDHNHDPPQKTKCSKERGPPSNAPSGNSEGLTVGSGDTNGSEPSQSKTSYRSVHNNDTHQKTKWSKDKGHHSGPSGDNETLTLASVDPNGSEPSAKMEQNSGGDTSEHQLNCSTDGEGVVDVKVEECHDREPDQKRRLIESPLPSPSSLFRTVKEPKVVVQATSDVGTVTDGYRWRKYGQKLVKGNPNPRSYYRCTQIGCPVRKHVERDSADEKAFLITYEGKHNHNLPTPKHDGDSPTLLIPTAAAVNADGRMQAPSSSADKKPKNEQKPDIDSKLPGEKPSDPGGDQTMESAQTLLSMGCKSISEEDGDRKSSDTIQRPLFNENRAAVPVQNS